MSTPQTRTPARWSAGWGVITALGVALIVFIPATWKLQDVMHVPAIDPTPAHLRATPKQIATSYWISWAIALTALISPAAVLAAISRTRRIAVGYLVTATIIGGILAAGVINFEVAGFAPN